jgi:hypothetical protein
LPDILIDNQGPCSGVGHGVYRYPADFLIRDNSLSGVAYIPGISQGDFFFKNAHKRLLPANILHEGLFV